MSAVFLFLAPGWKERATIGAFLGTWMCMAELGNKDGAVNAYELLLKDNELEAAAILYKVLKEKNFLTPPTRIE